MTNSIIMICIHGLDDRHAGQMGTSIRKGKNIHNCDVRNADWNNCWLLCVRSTAGPVGVGECLLYPRGSMFCLVGLLVAVSL